MKAAKDGQITGLLSPFLERTRLRQAVHHIPADAAILDIGCGRARILGHIPPPRRYTGLDILPVIQHNQLFYPAHEFVLADVQREALDRLGTFDVVLMLAVIEHFSSPEIVLGKIARLLSPAGRIIITTPHPRGERILNIGAMFRICSPEGCDEHQPLLSRRTLQELAVRAGLRLLHYRTFLCGMNQLAILGK